MTEIYNQLIDIKPGIYNISNEEYHASEGVSRSGLMLFRKSPMHYWDEYLNKDNVKEETPSEKLGSIIHKAILEPDYFYKTYVVAPAFNKRYKDQKIAYQNWCQENREKIIIENKDYYKASKIVDSVYRDRDSIYVLKGGINEQAIYWEENETLCKFKPDNMKQESGIVVDIKTTSSAEEALFSYSAKKYGYQLQAAMGKIAFEYTFRKKLDKFIFLAVETEKPYCTRIIFASDQCFDKGTEEFYKLLAIYQDCLDKNEWKTYDPMYLN